MHYAHCSACTHLPHLSKPCPTPSCPHLALHSGSARRALRILFCPSLPCRRASPSTAAEETYKWLVQLPVAAISLDFLGVPGGSPHPHPGVGFYLRFYLNCGWLWLRPPGRRGPGHGRAVPRAPSALHLTNPRCLCLLTPGQPDAVTGHVRSRAALLSVRAAGADYGSRTAQLIAKHGFPKVRAQPHELSCCRRRQRCAAGPVREGPSRC